MSEDAAQQPLPGAEAADERRDGEQRDDIDSPLDAHDSPASPPRSTTTTDDAHSRSSTPHRDAAAAEDRGATPPRERGSDSSPTSTSPRGAHSPSSHSSPTSSPSSSSRNEEGGDASSSSSPGPNHPPSRRVKVYKLKDDAWVDLGTGTCQGVLIQQNSPPGDNEPEAADKVKEKVDPADEGAWIVVKREKPKRDKGSTGTGDGEQDKDNEKDAARANDSDDEDEGDVILKTRVQPYPPGYSEEFDEEEVEGEDGATLDVGGYQRQQDTLIVWTERGDGDEEMEMALSFATSTGCAEMWEFIKAARRFTAEQAMLSPSPSPSLSSPRTFALHSTFVPTTSHLPTPTLGTIPQLELTIRALSRTAVSRERTAIQIVKTGFVEKLIDVHREAEDLESLEDLHALCRVMQTILLLNDNSIFDLVLKDELILGVAGILEYDPDFPTMKASYRAHLSSPTAFVSLVPIRSPSLLAKIHQTHRLHYLKDVILARILEDATFSMLNSAIYFNEVEIVNEVVGERELIRDVFQVLDEGANRDDVKGKGKGKERELGPKRTIGPELPDDLQVQQRTKRPRTLGDGNEHTSMDLDPAGSTSPRATAVEASRPSEPPASPPSVPAPPSGSETEPSQRKQHAIQFLAQLTQMAKNLQLPLRTSMYRTLVERGLLIALERALRFANELGDNALRGQVLAVWMSVVDLDAKDVRAYCLNQGKAKERQEEEDEGTGASERPDAKDGSEQPNKLDQTLLGGLIETFKVETDLGIKTQLAEALRVLVDAAGDGGPLEAPPRLQRQEDPEAEKFLQYFYDHCILSLLQPLIDLPERTEKDPPLALAPAQTALLSHLCDLLCFFIAHHTFRSKYLILSSPQLAKSVSRLLRPRPRLTRHTHLRLAALRFFRACVARNDDFYNRFLVKHDLVKAVVETADDEKDKDNLLGSACLEFFEYIRGTNAKQLINHLMDRCGETIRRLAAKFSTFEGLVARWEINNEPPPRPPLPAQAHAQGSSDAGSNGPAGAMSEAMTRQPSAPGWPGRMDMEEESYFNTDGDDDEDLPGPSPPPSAQTEALKPATVTSSFFPTSTSSSSSSPSTSTSPSARRKREPTSNPSLSSSLGANDLKRAKLDGEADAADERGDLKRSQSWPGGAKGDPGEKVGKGLVDYMDEDEDEADTGESAVGQAKESTATSADGGAEGAGPGGGFIREGEGQGGSADERPGSVSTAVEEASGFAPALPLPGTLKRKQEEEDEDGGFGLLRSKNAKKASSSSDPAAAGSDLSNATSTSTTGTGGGFKKVSPSPTVGGFKIKTSSPTLATSTSTATGSSGGGGTGARGGGGGFKIAFGSSAAKLASASGATASRSSTTGVPTAAASSVAEVDNTKDEQGKGATGKDAEGNEQDGAERGGTAGFGKFGTGAT
ncbi:hypothetical protein JCM10212_000125 [Sporobolomyces blumeae]